MGIDSTDPLALVVDVTISHRAGIWEAENGVGDYWWVSVLKALGGGGSDAKAKQPQPQNVRWF